MFTFKSGVHPKDNKSLSKNRPIRFINPNDKLVFPLNQHIGKIAKPIVNVGDNVLMGQIIAEADGLISANVLSSVSGRVLSIEDRLTINGEYCQSIIIENDFKYDPIENYGKENSLKDLSNEEIINIIKTAGIVGLGGACFPTHVKLSPKDPEKIDYILVNGAECEPYLTSDYRIMMEWGDKLIKGCEVLLKLFNKSKCIICIEDNKKDAYNIIKSKLNNNLSISLALMKTKYPQGGERQLIYAITKRKLCSKFLPADIGVIVQNVATVCAICDAVIYNKPLISKVITVTGDAVRDTANLLVPFGISYNLILDAVGGFVDTPEKIINGGPMMGSSFYSLDVPVTKNSSSVLAFREDPLKNVQTYNCINCGNCIKVCPVNLCPVFLNKQCEKNNVEKFIKLQGEECIECGACSYICPSNINLTQNFKIYKTLAKNFNTKELNNGKQ